MNRIINHLGIKNNRTAILFLVYFAAIFIISYIRLFFGVELTDEAYAIAETRLMANGSVPYVNIWTQVPGHTAFYYWFYPLYLYFNGSLEGYFLFCRQMSFLIKCVFLLVAYFLLKNKTAKIPLAIFMTLFLPFVTNNFWTLTYNTLSMLFLLLACAMIINGVEQTSQIRYIKLFVSGFITGCAVFTHQAVIIAALLMYIFLIIFIKKSIEKIKSSLSFLAGVLAFFTIVIIVLSASAGGINNLIEDVKIVFDSPYFHIYDSTSWESIIVRAITPFTQKNQALYSLYIALISFAAAFFYYILTNIKSDKSIKNFKFKTFQPFILTSLLLTWAVYILAVSVYDAQTGADIVNMGYANLRFYLTSAFLTLALYFLTNIKKFKPFIIWIWLPFFVYCMASSGLSRSGISNRAFLIYPCAILAVIIAQYMIDSEMYKNAGVKMKKIFKYTHAIFISAVTVCCIISSYAYVFRDSKVAQLNYRVDRGIYKGLFTTKENAEQMLMFEDALREHTDNDDKILVLDIAPFAYLMTDAKPYTPTTWDPMLSNYEYTDEDSDRADIMFEFFEREGSLPDKIIYAYWERDLSLFDDAMTFTSFVKENYDLEFQKEDMVHPLYIYKIKS